MLFYVQGVLIPYQRRDAAAKDRPRGNLSDLYPRWLGARELLLNGRDPYGPEITREIQLAQVPALAPVAQREAESLFFHSESVTGCRRASITCEVIAGAR